MKPEQFKGWMNGKKLAHAIKTTSLPGTVKAACGTLLFPIVDAQKERTKPACVKCMAWAKKHQHVD